MRKIIAILIFCLSTFVAKAGFLTSTVSNVVFYPTFLLGANGEIKVFNDGGTEAELSSAFYLRFGSAEPAYYIDILESGDLLYRLSNQYGRVDYVVSDDEQHMAKSVYMNGQWVFTTYYTTSRDEQQAFYAENKHKQTGGITFDYSWGDSNGSSSNRSTRGNSTCSFCGGSGVDRSSNTGGSLTSWVKYYNNSGRKCPYCGGYTEHFHDKCPHCMGSGRE